MAPCIDKSASAPTEDAIEPPVFQPTYYFFYGTLTKPEVLSHILDLDQEPTLLPATIEDYSLSMWGQYKTLLHGPPCNIIEGFAYEVQNEEDEDKLKYYETDAYECAPCLVTLKHEDKSKVVEGKTFMYAT